MRVRLVNCLGPWNLWIGSLSRRPSLALPDQQAHPLSLIVHMNLFFVVVCGCLFLPAFLGWRSNSPAPTHFIHAAHDSRLRGAVQEGRDAAA
jgi:hypothetical protein